MSNKATQALTVANRDWRGKIVLENELIKHTHKAINTLLALLTDDNPPGIRHNAAVAILDRAHGSPVQRSVIAALGQGNGQDISTMSTRDLLAQVLQLSAPTPATLPDHTPGIDFEMGDE